MVTQAGLQRLCQAVLLLSLPESKDCRHHLRTQHSSSGICTLSKGSLPINSKGGNIKESPYKFTPYNLNGPHTRTSSQRPQNVLVLSWRGYAPQNEVPRLYKSPGYCLVAHYPMSFSKTEFCFGSHHSPAICCPSLVQPQSLL